MIPVMTQIVDIKELEALVSLVDEPNEDMFDVIRQKILSYGKLAIPVLEDIWANTIIDDESSRIESIIEEIRQEILITDFNLWGGDNNKDIIEGLIIITKYFKPDFNDKYYITLFEKLCRDTWLELNDNLTALEKIKVLNHVFYRVYNFNSDDKSALNSDTYFLSGIFDNKTGSNMALGILYIAVAQKLNIPIYGVDLPGHFILAYLDSPENFRFIEEYSELDVIFYINASKDGSAFTRNEIRHYISKMKIEQNEKYYTPCSNLLVYKRLLKELIYSLELENKHSKSLVLKKLLQELHHPNNLSESALI
jgi:hypothetical protein